MSVRTDMFVRSNAHNPVTRVVQSRDDILICGKSVLNGLWVRSERTSCLIELIVIWTWLILEIYSVSTYGLFMANPTHGRLRLLDSCWVISIFLCSCSSWVFLSDLDIPLLFLSCSRMYDLLLILLRAVPISPTIDTYTNSLVVSTLFWDNQIIGILNQQTPHFDSFQNNVDLESWIDYRVTFHIVFSSPPFWKGSKGSRA